MGSDFTPRTQSRHATRNVKRGAAGGGRRPADGDARSADAGQSFDTDYASPSVWRVRSDPVLVPGACVLELRALRVLFYDRRERPRWSCIRARVSVNPSPYSKTLVINAHNRIRTTSVSASLIPSEVRYRVESNSRVRASTVACNCKYTCISRTFCVQREFYRVPCIQYNAPSWRPTPFLLLPSFLASFSRRLLRLRTYGGVDT